MRWNTVRTLRWVMVGVGLVAGIVLLTAGATLFGVILLVMATLRVAMLLAVRRRMRLVTPAVRPVDSSRRPAEPDAGHRVS